MSLEIAQQYDLTNTVSKHLDRHMVFPMLEFLTDKKLVRYPVPLLSPPQFADSIERKKKMYTFLMIIIL